MYNAIGERASGLLIGVLNRADIALYVITMLAMLTFVGVVLPAVWSGKAMRRRAAKEVLQQILDFLRYRSQ